MHRIALAPATRVLIALGLSACLAPGGCSPSSGGIDEPTEGGRTGQGGRSSGGMPSEGGSVTLFGGKTSSSGGASTSQCGVVGEAGAANAGVGGDSGGATSGLDGGAENGGWGPSEGGTAPSGSGGVLSSAGGSTSQGGNTGFAGHTAWPTHCVFNSDVGGAPNEPEEPEEITGGAGPAPTITMPKNGFAGTFLADGAGRALYVYGADLPGDCEHPAITTCYNDCAVAWPIFNGEPRVLAAGLDESLFGSIRRTDGTVQTTYRGWPLYYYKSDVGPGDVKGQAVGRIWHLAQTVLPNIVIIRVETTRFLADGEGHALYVSAADTKGTATSAPVSACSGTCFDSYDPFSPTYISPVTYLVSGDFSYFVRADGIVQLAYKGAPLYHAFADVRSATMNGVAPGWTLAAP